MEIKNKFIYSNYKRADSKVLTKMLKELYKDFDFKEHVEKEIFHILEWDLKKD